MLKTPGVLLYYGSESDANNGGAPKGEVVLNDILPGSMGIKLVEGKNEIVLVVENRNFNLRASNAADAHGWVTLLKAWVSHINGD